MVKVHFIFFLLTYYVQAQQQGRVTLVKDGDTFEILVDNAKHNCRLAGVDAPELSQPFGMVSRDSVRRMLEGKVIIFRFLKEDLYRRWVVSVSQVEGQTISIENLLIQKGWAWNYEQYNKLKSGKKLQQEAQTNHRGLWVCPNPIPPWIYRGMNAQYKRWYATCK